MSIENLIGSIKNYILKFRSWSLLLSYVCSLRKTPRSESTSVNNDSIMLEGSIWQGSCMNWSF